VTGGSGGLRTVDPGAGSVSAIVLAGGRSSRFGSDKLAAEVEGRSLLERAVEATAAVAAEVVVVLAQGDARRLPDRIGDAAVRRVEDPIPFGGPLQGLLAGLELARGPIIVLAGGDMPALDPRVLELLIGTLRASPERRAAVLERRGRLEQLPAALRNGAATEAARRLLAGGERSLTSLLTALDPVRVDEAEWRGLDPSAATLRDVDRPADL
jgi:molybdopterin-guanine dinucleotide biosynthesis protein A